MRSSFLGEHQGHDGDADQEIEDEEKHEMGLEAFHGRFSFRSRARP
jgi:hypothetical protein